MKKVFIILVLVVSASLPLAEGHPFTIQTDPPQGSNAPAGITQVVVHYSEAIEIDFSALKVLDSSGEQIDNKDTSYFEGEDSLVVTTPPLSDGVYTVTSKVLSKVDGHLVDYAFVFAVGDIAIDPSLLEKQGSPETLFFPEAGARFPGLVGQTIVLGTVIASLLVWGTQRKNFLHEQLDKLHEKYHSKFMSLTGIGLIVVFASNILMMVVQTWRLQTSVFDVLMTSFGTTWIIRMGITITLLAIWFVMERKFKLTGRNQVPLLALSLALIATTTMMGHGAASEEVFAVSLDYIHNLIAAVWIGGIIFFGFCLLPSLTSLNEKSREMLSLALIPRFSIMIVISLGILIISGPTLLWFLESNVGLLLESTYGRLILAKIAIAAVMIGFGSYKQFRIQKRGEAELKNGTVNVHKRLRRSLKVESALGVALLGVVALLANGSLPAGEVQQAQAQEVTYGFDTVKFSENAKFEISINPFTSGQNTISVIVLDLENSRLPDIDSLKIKVSNPHRNIAPIEIPITEIENEKTSQITYEGDVTFGFSGNWLIEIEAQRTQNANENVFIDVLVKPRLVELKTQITEFDFPEKASPLYPLFDGDDTIWISDPSKGRLWKFSLDNQEFNSYEFEGKTSIVLAIDNNGKIWFTNTPDNKIGFFEPRTEEITVIDLPMESIPISLQSDLENNIWVSLFDKNLLLKYDQKTNQFEEFNIPTEDGGPFALTIDSTGNIWFSESQAGKIGVIDPKTGDIREFSPETPIESPEALYFDDNGNLWISAHTGLSLIKFNPVLETFSERIVVPNPDALPFGMTQDKYGNIWFAQHTVDTIGVYDPYNDNLREVEIPTQTSFVQFMTTDNEGNIWFVEQEANKLGMLKITEIPQLGASQAPPQQKVLKYTELVSPLISMGIIATSLFFVKAIQDKRRINELIS